MSLELVGQSGFHEVPNCVICQKTLGAESRDMGYLVCHEHRKCVKCGNDLYPREVQLCYDRLTEEVAELENLNVSVVTISDHFRPIHPRCEAIERAAQNPNPTLSLKQSEFDFLNLLRFAVYPDIDLTQETNENNAMSQASLLIKDMDTDGRYLFLLKLEACVAVVSNAVNKSRKELQAEANEREKLKAHKAQREALTSSRPAGKKPDDEAEILLGEFMKLNGIENRATAKKLKRMRDDAINALTALGVPTAMAQTSVDTDLKKRGLIK